MQPDQITNQMIYKSGKISGRVHDRIRVEICAQVEDLTWNGIRGRVWSQVGGRVYDQVHNQVSGRVRGQFRSQTRW